MMRAAAPAVSPSVPPVSRTDAQHAAQAELAKSAYHRHDPSLIQRALSWVVRELRHALDTAAIHSPGKGIGLLVIVVVVACVITVVAVRVGGVRRSVAGSDTLFDHDVVDAAHHRRRARAFAAESRWAEAVREWLRAIARELEARGVLDVGPGRTAAELCAEAAGAMPAIATDLRAAATAFDAIWYGGRRAMPDDERALRELDARIAGSHRSLVAVGNVAVGNDVAAG